MLRQELPEQQAKEYTETVTVSSEAGTDCYSAASGGYQGSHHRGRLHWHAEAGYRFHYRRACRIQKQFVDSIRDPHYPNLSSMDLEYIPKTTTENGRTLNFSTVDWQTDNTENVDDDAIGDRFSAIVTYTGTASSRNVTG